MNQIYQFFTGERKLIYACRPSAMAVVFMILSGLIPQYASAGMLNASSLVSVMFTEQVVSGKVTDDTGAPLPGVNVLEKGTNNGTVTDSEGNYRITVSSAESVLVFSFVGTTRQEVHVGNQSSITVQLLSDASTLSEIVVTGYGTQQKRDITGAVTSIKSEDFNKGIINTPEQLLQGKVAGVNVTSASGEPGATQSITVRGPGGIRTGSTPLFVVDGLALDNSSTGGATNPLNFINPQDIESIDVLKDASATAIYGARGANGVIIITTKKGKAGKSSATYSAGYGISTMARAIDVFDAKEFVKQVNAIDGDLIDRGASTDWQKEISRTAITQNHNLTLSGGADNLTYYASLGLQNQDGILKESNLKRYTGRINITQRLANDRIRIDMNMNATNTVSTRPPVEDILGTALRLNPTYPVYENGKLATFGDGTNPLLRLKLYDDITNTTRIIGNISPSVEIIKGLVYKLNFGIDNSNSVQDIQALPSTDPAQDGRLDSYFDYNRNSLIENYVTYDFKTGAHKFSVLAGQSYQKIFVQTRYWSISKFPANGIEPRYNAGLGSLFSFTGDSYNPANTPSGTATKNELQSFFGRVNYEFNDRYLLTATLRTDGSSKFGKNNKYGTFPSFALGWRLTQEAFMESLPFSELKLRAGWGQTGNQEIPSKITQASFKTTVSSDTSYPLSSGNTYLPGTVYSRFANPDIQWEVSTQTNIGLDFGLLQGALTGTVDYFRKVSDNILLEVTPSDPIQPARTYWTNVKDMTITNQGLEVSLNYQIKTANEFTYDFGGNITFINNKVEDSPFTLISTGVISGSGLTSASANGYMNGEPIGTFYLLKFTGIDENGNSTFQGVPPGTVPPDNARVVSGSALPKTMYSFYGRAGFKGFDLSLNFNGVSGNKIYDNTANASFYKTLLAKSQNTTADAVKYPNEADDNPATISTRYLKNGAYLRLNNATLGYNFSPGKLGLGNWITALRVSVTGQNLFVITDYDGYDPEVNTDKSDKGISSYGIDYLSYPKARSIMFGLNVSF